jgi:pimeloyl-CoA synthetase
LWELPTSYLGIQGAGSWREEDGWKGKGTSAFTELVEDGYEFVFVRRIRSLKAQLLLKDNVDGLVFLSIRNFVHDRQVEHDPIGAQSFAVVHEAIRGAVEEGELRVVRGDEKIRNDTVLSFGGGDAESPAGELSGLAARWNDALLPGLVTSRGREQDEVVLRLRSLLSTLPGEGIQTFRFQDLIEPLKADVRLRWASLFELEQGERIEEEKGKEVPVTGPDTQFEERQYFRKLADCVLRGVEVVDANKATRRYLATLFQFLRVQSGERMNPDRSAGLRDSVAAEVEAEDDGPLSHRRLAEHLRIPRERIKGLFEILGRLLQDCRASVGGRSRAENASR